MAIPYRTRRTLGRIGAVLLVLLAVFTLVCIFQVIRLGRYVVYTDHGIEFDFDRSSLDISGQPAVPPAEQETVSIYYNEGDNAVNVAEELTQINGYYISTQDLEGDLSALKEQLKQLPPEMAVMVEVKNIYGEFNYATAVGDYYNSNVDMAAVEDLIEYLKRNGHYTIASVPAFQDQLYGLNNVDEGLFSTGGAYLYVDDLRCYWLSPSSDKVISYLAQIATELRIMGFNEVVFDQFLFPNSDTYRFSGDKQQALADAAATLMDACATNYFAVSFVSNTGFALPEGRSRLYLRGVEASDVAGVVENMVSPDNTIHLVFLTDYHDTRYDVCSVLRPITAMK